MLITPQVHELGGVIRALAGWQRDDAPIQLHPGDLGWSWRDGPEPLARRLRVWSRAGRPVALGFLDGPEVLRLTVAPDVWRDEVLARELVADLDDPTRGILPSGTASVEVPDGTSVQERLSDVGWGPGEGWAPLRLDLSAPVRPPALAVEVVRSLAQIAEATAVHRSAWGNDRLTDERWQVLAAGPAFADACCLLARDEGGTAVATVTGWSAGPGRPGLIEPLGVHADHRRRGYGAAICLALAAELQARGCSSLLVCTPASLVSAVATYRAAGFERLPDRLDRVRGAAPARS